MARISGNESSKRPTSVAPGTRPRKPPPARAPEATTGPRPSDGVRLRSSRTAVSALERDPAGTESDPSASRELTARQAGLSRSLVGASPGATHDSTISAAVEAEQAQQARGTRQWQVEKLLSQDPSLEELVAGLPDDEITYDALESLLQTDYNVTLVDVGEEATSQFANSDLLGLAHQLSNLPPEIREAYLAENQQIRVVNGPLNADPEYANLNPNLDAAGGEDVSTLGGQAHHLGPDGSGAVSVTLDGLRDEHLHNRGDELEGEGGTASLLLHELGHALDDVGGEDQNFFDFSSAPEFRDLLGSATPGERNEVGQYWDQINIDGSYHQDDPEGRYIEAFAELFARYHAGADSRDRLPPSVQEYFAGLEFTPTV